MSTLTSLVKSGKRTIAKKRTDFTTATKTAPGLPDQGVSHDQMRPEKDTQNSSGLTTLRRPDLKASKKPNEL